MHLETSAKLYALNYLLFNYRTYKLQLTGAVGAGPGVQVFIGSHVKEVAKGTTTLATTPCR